MEGESEEEVSEFGKQSGSEEPETTSEENSDAETVASATCTLFCQMNMEDHWVYTCKITKYPQKA